MKTVTRKLAVVLILSGFSLAGGLAFPVEFEVLDRFSVDGYSEFRGTVSVPSGGFSVGVSTFVVKGGNVGIGTTEPLGKLHVSGHALLGTGFVPGTDPVNSAITGASLLGTMPAIAGEYGQLSVYSSDAFAVDTGGLIGLGGLMRTTAGNDYVNFAKILGAKENGASGNYSGYLAFYTRLSGGVPGERARITSTGNVGIGTTDPGAKLEVAGQVKITGGTPGINKVLIDSDGTGLAAWTTFASQTPWSSNINAAGYTLNGNSTSGGSLTLDSTSNGTKGNVLINPSGGNVGIGTATPAAEYALDVVGKIRATVGQGLYSIAAACPSGGAITWIATCSPGSVCRSNWWANYYTDCTGACPYSSSNRSAQTCDNTLLGRMLSP